MDAIIATSVNSSLKACAAGFARSATECSSPHLRNLMAKASQDAIRRQEQLTALMEQRGWYVPPEARQEDIDQILTQLRALTAPRARGGPGLAGLGRVQTLARSPGEGTPHRPHVWAVGRGASGLALRQRWGLAASWQRVGSPGSCWRALRRHGCRTVLPVPDQGNQDRRGECEIYHKLLPPAAQGRKAGKEVG